MKSTTIIFCLFFYTTYLFGQAPLIYLDNKISGGLYIGVGIHQPRGITKAKPTGENGIFGALSGDDGLGLTAGPQLEVGLINYFGSKRKKRTMALGLSLDVKVSTINSSSNSFKIDSTTYDAQFDFSSPELSAALGLVFSINPTGNLILSLNTKIRGFYTPVPSFYISYEDDYFHDYEYYSFGPENYSEEESLFVVSPTFGFNIDYNHFFFSVEWTSFKISEDYIDYYNSIDLQQSEVTQKFVDITLGIHF